MLYFGKNGKNKINEKIKIKKEVRRKMAEEVLKTNIQREEKYIYFCKGNPIVIYKVKAGRPKKKTA